MEQKDAHLPPDLYEYLLAHNPPIDPLLEELVAETKAMGNVSRMQVSVEQAAFLAFLIKLLEARQVVEIGTFTGLSSLVMARALPEGGHLHCFDISEQFTAMARRFWVRDGVDSRITLHLGPAQQNLAFLESYPPVDLAFVDADKTGYIDYYETLLGFLSPHGIIIADNLFMGGRVLDPNSSPDASAMVAFASHLQADPRTETIIVPIGDGFSLTRKL